MSEQRHFHRIKFDVNVSIEGNGAVYAASLVDISLKGVLVESHHGYAPALGDFCHLTINLNDSDVVISFDGVVVHRNGELIGIKIKLIGIDSMIHLRRLVTLNSENPEQVREELNALFGFADGDGAEESTEVP